LDWSNAFQRQEDLPSPGNKILQSLGRPFEVQGCPCLADGDIHASKLRVVYLSKEDEIGARIHNRDGDGPIVFARLCFGGSHCFLCIFQCDVFCCAGHGVLLPELRSR